MTITDELMSTDEAMRLARVTRSRIQNWRRQGLLTPHYRIGPAVLTTAEAEARFPAHLTFPWWTARDVELLTMMRKLVDAGLNSQAAARIGRELIDRPRAAVFLAPGIVIWPSVCTCPEECNPLLVDYADARAATLPVVELDAVLADPRPAVTL